MIDSAWCEVSTLLQTEGERLFGWKTRKLTILHTVEREASTVLKVAVSGSGGVDTIFVKFFKSRPGEPAPDAARQRLVRDFELTARLYEALAGSERHRVVRPLACFPDQLALITAEVPGSTLLAVLERRAAWWPTRATRRQLAGALGAVGTWVRAFQEVVPQEGTFSLDAMGEYIDVRLQRLLKAGVLSYRGYGRVHEYLGRTAAMVGASDLRLVLTHADLAPSNIIVGAHEITVIDFAMVQPGGLFMDVARLYTQLEFLTSKPYFRRDVVSELQESLLEGFEAELQPDRPLFQLFVLQHLVCHMSNLARNPAPPLALLYNRHQLRLRQQWLETITR